MANSKCTRDQERAQDAYVLVSKVAAEEPWKKKYGVQCLRLPALIHQCGLCQAISFFQARGGEKHPYFNRALDDLAKLSRKAASRDELARAVREARVKEYQWWTREAMACAEWLKRYCQAVLKIEPGEDSDR